MSILNVTSWLKESFDSLLIVISQVGCEDGRVRLFEITTHDLVYNKSLDQQEGTYLHFQSQLIGT